MTPPQYPKGDVRALLRRFVQPGQTVVDVGAAVGEMTAIMAECVGDTGTVYAFEPTRTKMHEFSKHMQPVTSHAHVVVEQVAIGEQPAFVPIRNPSLTTASRWHGDVCGAETVKMTTLDDRFPTEAIDLVKIDTQGSESHILDGAVNLLKRCPIWILELWPWGLETAGRSAEHVVSQLRSAGLTPRWANGASPVAPPA